MIKEENDEEMDESFNLDNILPKYIINADGEKEPFDVERIKKGLIIDVGLDDKNADEIIESVIRKVVGLLSLSYTSISTHAIQDFITDELKKKNLDKFVDIYERIEKKKKTKFVLPDEFIDTYKGKQPDWGPLGYITFKRTYARKIGDGKRTEEFYETLKRVVEGCFSLQKEHCMKLRLPWDEDKALKSAKVMYEKMWNFKFIAPGRGLWTMGTPFIDRHGSMALNNCGFTSTEDIDIKGPMAFEWCMDALMLGVGVGFDTKGAGKVTIKTPKSSDHIFKIPDSREGWVRALGKVLNGFFYGESMPTFDYTLIRPKGAPIKGFGGVASGPDPLKQMLNDVKDLLIKKIGKTISSTDIVDIFNMIGKCVVAGNVRRSAEIALGNIEDNDFITMKQDKELLKHHRWASNNSVIATVGMDYTPIIDSIANNGEPGVIWLENAKNFSRMRGEPDFKDSKAAGVNPCVTGDTLIAVADGREAVPIKKLAEENKDIPVYCKNSQGITAIRMMRNPRLTGENVKIFAVELDDGSIIKCTDNHKFLLSNGNMVAAENLSQGDSLMLMSKWETTWNEIMDQHTSDKKTIYWMINDGAKNHFEHTFIYEHFSGMKTKKGEVIHHRDHNGRNNSFNNLELMEKSTHDILHDISGNNNPMRTWYPTASNEEKQRYHEKMLLATFGKNNARYSGFDNDFLFKHMINLIDETHIPLTVPAWKKYAQDNNLIYNFNYFRGKLINLIKKANIQSGFEHFDNPAQMREYKRYIKLLNSSDLELIFNNGIFVVKYCEDCGRKFFVKYSHREQDFCSKSCSNKHNAINAGKQTKQDGRKRHKIIKRKIDILFKKFITEKRYVPNAKEFFSYLNQNGINDLRTAGLPSSYEKYLSMLSENYSVDDIAIYKLRNAKYCRQLANQFLEHGMTYNHKVKSVKYIGIESVYNGTVDEFHNYGIVLSPKATESGRRKQEIIFTANCGEQTLESFELCCLVETFPSRHESYEEYQETLKYAYLYAKSVTLQNTHWSVTNAVMGKNRRIGTSQSGIIDAFNKHGRKTMLDWCDKGYQYLKHLDEIYSDWLCIPKSIKITSVKPSGTVSLLPGVTSGIHYPHSRYYIRRIRVAKNSELVPIIREAGYKVEDDVYSNNAYVAEFPIYEKYFDRSKKDVSIWEQFENAAAYQKHWADNQVSITITFKPEEVKDLKYCLTCYEDKLKGVSLLPLIDHGYEQAPLEEITKEQYEEMTRDIKPLNLESFNEQGEGEEGCTTDVCKLKEEVAKIKASMEQTGSKEEVVKIEKGENLFEDFCFDDDPSDDSKI